MTFCGRTEIGLYLFNFVSSPSLGMGVTFALFHSKGIEGVSRLKLNRLCCYLPQTISDPHYLSHFFSNPTSMMAGLVSSFYVSMIA